MSNKIDATGKRFGRLVVQYDTGNKYNNGSIWHVKCDCGNEFDVPLGRLTSKNTKSCGCYKRESMSERMSKPFIIKRQNLVWKNYRRNAITRNHEMHLNKEELLLLASKPCHYCGIKPVDYHGVDRVNSSLGYTHENTVACCWMCNRAKGDSTVEEFISWAERLYNYNKDKNNGN